jgi:hypothetical protein
MTISQMWTIIGVNIGLFAIMIGFYFHLDSKFEAKFGAVDAKFDAVIREIHQLAERQAEEIHKLAERQAEMNGTLTVIASMAHTHPEMPVTAHA